MNRYTVFSKTTKNSVYVTDSENPLVLIDPTHVSFLGEFDWTWRLKDDYSEPIKKTQQELEPVAPVLTEEMAWNLHRETRDSLLKNTDWITVKYTERGEPIPQVWLDYRQALRDITSQPLRNIVWPTKPTT